MPELKVPEGDSLPTACLTCALYGSNPGFESVRRVTLDFGVRPPKICTTSIRHLPTRIFFHHQGWLQLQCPLETPIPHDRACGGTPISGLLLAARGHHLIPHLLDLRNSGDTAGSHDQVVGYASFAFTEDKNHVR